MSCGGGGAPSKRMRKATLSSCASAATVPMLITFDSPVPENPSCGTPHSGPTRGNSTNSNTISGAPSAAVLPARPAAVRRLGVPAGMWASTSAVSRPQIDSSIIAATPRLCE